MKELEEILGYSFKNKSLLKQALTHSSYANENKDRGARSNERLEFLGDSVLGFTAAEYLYEKFKKNPEGELTRLRAALVCEQSLAGAALRLGLGKYLSLGRGEEGAGGRERSSILADAVEAVLGAIYLDGGLETARSFVIGNIVRLQDIKEDKLVRDYKTLLQEHVQRVKDRTLEYRQDGEEGPDHDKIFSVSVLLNGNVIGEGRGRSKKEAEQAAAGAALKALENGA